MKRKSYRYDENAFIILLLLVGLHLLLGSCSASRQSAVERSAESNEITARSEQKSEFRSGDTISGSFISAGQYSNADSGRVEIRRDSAGRPVLLLWQHSGFMQGTARQAVDGHRRIGGSYADSSRAAATESKVAEEKKSETKTEAGTNPFWPIMITLCAIVLVSAAIKIKK